MVSAIDTMMLSPPRACAARCCVGGGGCGRCRYRRSDPVLFCQRSGKELTSYCHWFWEACDEQGVYTSLYPLVRVKASSFLCCSRCHQPASRRAKGDKIFSYPPGAARRVYGYIPRTVIRSSLCHFSLYLVLVHVYNSL